MARRYADSDSDEGIVEELTLDCLPFDCIVLVCQFLPPNDLARFSRVCKFFHEASLIGSLWRKHSLIRWVFCDIHQISDGPNRWKRYYSARRKVEARQEQGRPGRDYKVKTLRGHEADIQSVEVVGGGSVNWEKPKPPLVVSLSSDGNVKAWDVLQAEPVWSLEGGGVTSMAASERYLEVATGGGDGSITLWDCEEWKEKGRLMSSVGTATRLQYGRVKCDQLPGTFLIASIAGGVGHSDQIELWDTGHLSAVAESADEAQAAPPTKPFLELWAPSQIQRLLLSSQGLLAVEAGFGEVHIWDLLTLTESADPPPHHPHVTLHTPNHVGSSCWEGSGCLATRSLGGVNIDMWDVGSHLTALKKAGRSLYDNRNIYNPVRSIPCSSTPIVMTRFHAPHALPVVPTSALCCARGLLMVGGQEGELVVVNPKTGEEVQKFKDHRGAITDIYADHYRVLTCSKDFSIRVYRWLEGRVKQDLPQLESRYTLLGGSVAHKTHDGFQQLVCEAGSCVGVCGPQLKFYTFACKLD